MIAVFSNHFLPILFSLYPKSFTVIPSMTSVRIEDINFKDFKEFNFLKAGIGSNKNIGFDLAPFFRLLWI